MKQDEIDASHLISYQLITTHILSPFPFPFPSNKNIESFDQYLCGGKLNTKLKKKKKFTKCTQVEIESLMQPFPCCEV